MIRVNRSLVLPLASIAALALVAACGGQVATPPPAPSPETQPAPTAAPEAAPSPTPPPTPPAKPAQVSKPAPQPAAPPPPEPVVKTVPAGTVVSMVLGDPLSSETSKVGDTFRATVSQAIVVDGIEVIPVGTVARGVVVEANPRDKVGGLSRLGIRFESVELPGGAGPLTGQWVGQGKSETKKDAATIGGATAAGAILGRVLDKNDKGRGTAIGAVVGAAAGTAAAVKTKGEAVDLPVGSTLEFHLESPLEVRVR